MTISAEVGPSSLEVRRQMDRMLATRVLANRSRLSPLFRYVVEESLRGREGAETRLSEPEIGVGVFGNNYDATGSAVRTNATLLREQIQKYYIQNGSEDLVLIEIPPGAYRVVFSYNRVSTADQYYRRGQLHFGNYSPYEDTAVCLNYFKDAIACDPNHALAHAAKAEVELREAMYRETYSPWEARLSTREAIGLAESSALQALRLQPKLWRPHVVLGIICASRYHWDEAREHFEAALQIAPNRTAEHFWYHAYLLVIGRTKEAMDLAHARLDDRPEDPSAHLALAFLLYVTREFKRAKEIVSDISKGFSMSWLAGFIEALVDAALDWFFESAETISDYWHIGALERFWISGMIFARCSGFHMLHSRCGVPKKDFLSDLKGVRPGDPGLQRTMYCVVMGLKDDAIRAAKQAIEEGDLLTPLLPLLPIFDSLRNDEEFQALIRQMNIPNDARA